MIGALNWAALGVFGVVLVLVLGRITVGEREPGGARVLRRLDAGTWVAVIGLVALLVLRVLAQL